MAERIRIDVSKYPTIALVEPGGEFGGPVDYMIKAIATLKDVDQIAQFALETSSWLGIHLGDSDLAAERVGEWVSSSTGHMNDASISKLWQRAVPQVDLGSGFMPSDKTIRIRKSANLADDFKNAVQKILRD